MIMKIRKQALSGVLCLLLAGAFLIPGHSRFLSAFAKSEEAVTDTATESLEAQDLSSKELLLSTEELLSEDESHVVSRYGDTYLLSYETEAETEDAYIRNYEQTEGSVSPNLTFTVAEGEAGSEPTGTDGSLDCLTELTEGAEPLGEDSFTIALIDTGVPSDADVTDAVSLLGGEPWDDNGHGSQMLSVIREANPEASVLSIKALDANGTGNVASVYSAIEYAISRNVSVINLSISAHSVAENRIISDVIQKAEDAGILVIGAAGNQGEDASGYLPGSLEPVWVIGSAGEDGSRQEWSNYGDTVDYNVVSDSTSAGAAMFSGQVSKANGDLSVIGAEANVSGGWLYTTDYAAEPVVDTENNEIINTPNIEIEEDTSFYAQATTLHRTGVTNATGYDFVLNRLPSFAMSASDSRWIVSKNINSYTAVMFNEVLSPGTHSLPGPVTITYSNCVEASDGKLYDLRLSLSNITVTSKNTMDRPTILLRNGGTSQFCASDYDYSGDIGVNMDVTYRLINSETGAPASGSLLLGFTDLDRYDQNYTFEGGPKNYREGFTLISGALGDVWIEPDTLLELRDNNTTFVSTQQTDTLGDQLRAGVSFLADANGTKINWGGFSCVTTISLDMDAIWPQHTIVPSSIGPGSISPSKTVTLNQGMNQTFMIEADENAHIKSVTVDGKDVEVTNPESMTYSFTGVREDHTIHVVFEKDTHTQVTRVRWQNVDGSWSDYQTVDSKTVAYGEPYSYTWVRNAIKNEPATIYKDGSPNPVGTSSVTGSATYSINVGRKQYTYTFNFNPPSGYSVSEIGNRQRNLTNKYAETMSGTVKTPTLTGYTFRGWNTKADGSGAAYANEEMLSNKTFYAIWKANSYTIKYDGNGNSNPNHQTGEFTQNTVTSKSGMPDSTYQYDQTGTLRKNDFVREGYTFVGWNTKRDGSGTSYPDQYNKVRNLTSSDGGTITLYAQWEKKLGTETITVVSEETGNPVAGVSMKLYRKANGSWQDTGVSGVTNKKGQVTVNDLHWFDYEWRSVKVPEGYETMGTTGFSIRYDRLSQTNQVVLYLKEVSITLNSQVSDMIDGENPPAFLYQISGTDAAGVEHTYHVMVETDASGKGQNRAVDLFAGMYTITQIPVQRYVPGPAEDLGNVSVSGINGTADVLHHTEAEVRFPYTISQYGGFSHTDEEINSLNP